MDVAVQTEGGKEFQSLEAATEKALLLVLVGA